MSLKKWICVLSVLKAIIPTHFLCQTECSRSAWSLILSNWYPSSEREIKFRRCLFTSSIKREIGIFRVVVVQKRQRNVQKSVLHVRSVFLFFLSFFFFFFFFLTFSLPSASLDLKVSNSKLWEITGHHKYFALVCNNMTAYPDTGVRRTLEIAEMVQHKVVHHC